MGDGETPESKGEVSSRRQRPAPGRRAPRHRGRVLPSGPSVGKGEPSVGLGGQPGGGPGVQLPRARGHWHRRDGDDQGALSRTRDLTSPQPHGQPALDMSCPEGPTSHIQPPPRSSRLLAKKQRRGRSSHLARRRAHRGPAVSTWPATSLTARDEGSTGLDGGPSPEGPSCSWATFPSVPSRDCALAT